MDLLMNVDWPLFLAFVSGAGLGIVAGYLLRAWRVDETSGTDESESNKGEPHAPEPHAVRVAAAPEPHTTRHAPQARASQRSRSWPTVAEPPVSAEAEAAYAISGDWDAEGDGPQVLLVDDRLEMLGVHATYLRKHGYRVLLAENGTTAVAFARAYHPALIVLDYSMPDRTGVEVARELKADRATADIPILLMTAHSYGAVGASALAAGCSGFLTKPVEPSRLLREIAARTPKH